MSIVSFVSRQLGHPEGVFGRVLLRMLNRANAGMNRMALDRLALRPGDRLLEVGFGGGDLIARALKTGLPHRVAGAERSAPAVGAARRRFRREIERGLVDVRLGDAADLPFETGTFSAVCSVNTVYFWPDPPAILSELRRVLASGGRLVLGYNAAPPPQTRTVRPAELERLMREAGFTEPSTQETRDGVSGRSFYTRAGVP